MAKNKSIKVDIEIDPERSYTIEDLSLFTGYSTGYIRNMERAKKIPLAERDAKGWRYWHGTEVVAIINQMKEHNLISNNSNLLGKKLKSKKK